MSEKLINKIKNVRDNCDDLRNHVIEYILKDCSDDEEVKNFFNDIMQHGCVSGMVGHLIYYYDTHKFYDKYYDEIETMREEYEDMLGTSINVKGDLKNFYAWFGFEETCRKLAEELDLY